MTDDIKPPFLLAFLLAKGSWVVKYEDGDTGIVDGIEGNPHVLLLGQLPVEKAKSLAPGSLVKGQFEGDWYRGTVAAASYAHQSSHVARFFVCRAVFSCSFCGDDGGGGGGSGVNEAFVLPCGQVNRSGGFDIKFDDGDFRSGTPLAEIQLFAPVPSEIGVGGGVCSDSPGDLANNSRSDDGHDDAASDRAVGLDQSGPESGLGPSGLGAPEGLEFGFGDGADGADPRMAVPPVSPGLSSDAGPGSSDILPNAETDAFPASPASGTEGGCYQVHACFVPAVDAKGLKEVAALALAAASEPEGESPAAAMTAEAEPGAKLAALHLRAATVEQQRWALEMSGSAWEGEAGGRVGQAQPGAMEGRWRGVELVILRTKGPATLSDCTSVELWEVLFQLRVRGLALCRLHHGPAPSLPLVQASCDLARCYALQGLWAQVSSHAGRALALLGAVEGQSGDDGRVAEGDSEWALPPTGASADTVPMQVRATI